MAKQKTEDREEKGAAHPDQSASEKSSGNGEFTAKARPVEVLIGGNRFMAMPKRFSTGSLGWYLNAKTSLPDENGSVQPVQIGLNLTIVGSKPKGDK
jgi:hypothetical protein